MTVFPTTRVGLEDETDAYGTNGDPTAVVDSVKPQEDDYYSEQGNSEENGEGSSSKRITRVSFSEVEDSGQHSEENGEGASSKNIPKVSLAA